MGTREEINFAVYQRERIVVDEMKWFDFFRKERWYDWIHVPENFEEDKAGETWSVDDPKLWDMLRVIIELANRMLKALIQDGNKGGR